MIVYYNSTEKFTVVNSNTKLIGATSSGDIYGFDGVNPAGFRLPGALVNVSLKNNDAWGVNNTNNIYYGDITNPTSTNWIQLTGLLVQITVDDLGDIIAGVNNSDNIYVANSNIKSTPNWTLLPRLFMNVAISNSKLYAVNRANEIYYKPDITTTDNWVKLTGQLKQIAYTENGSSKLIGVNSSNDVYYADSGLTSSPNWMNLNKKMNYVAFFRGYIFGIDSQGAIWAYDNLNKTWIQTNLPQNLNQISLYPR